MWPFKKKVKKEENRNTFLVNGQELEFPKSNRFIVKLNGTLNVIPEWIVSCVGFYPRNNELSIRFMDCMINIDGTDVPLIKILSNCKEDFNVNVEHLNSIGCTMYTDKYDGVHIKEIARDCLDYKRDDISSVDIICTYKSVDYE